MAGGWRRSSVYFDSTGDIALLNVRNLNQTPLSITAAKVGDRAAVFGHPGGQDQLRIAPAWISQQVTARGLMPHDFHRTDRDVFVLSSTLHPGDSGVLTDLQGRVVGMAFAIAADEPNTAYAADLEGTPSPARCISRRCKRAAPASLTAERTAEQLLNVCHPAEFVARP